MKALSELLHEYVTTPPEERNAGEKDYRRGYHQGFGAALDALERLQIEGRDAGEAFAALCWHELKVAHWRNNVDAPDTPPAFKR